MITDVKATYPKWRHASVPGRWQYHFWQIVVRVESDAGVVGVGLGGGGTPAVEVVNRHFRELLVGRTVDSVDDIRAVWDVVYAASIPYGRKGVAVMALSGVDLALWDLLGKAEGVPVHELIGPLTRQRVRAYASGPDVEWYRELGVTANKLSSRWTGDESEYDDMAEAAECTRRVLGQDCLLMIDCYMSWDAPVVREMARRLAEFNIYWFEDLLTPDRLSEQAVLREQIKPVLAAGGEHEFTHHGFAEIARAGALDLWQPDVTWCGGLTAALRILELAREHGVPVVPHRGGEVWGLHLIVATQCDDLAERVLRGREAPQDRLWTGEPEIEGGYIAPSDRPGFGVTLNEDML